MKYYIALFQKIKDYYESQSANAREIALICPSLRVFEESEMKLLLPQILITEEMKGEALLKKESISLQLNSLPDNDKYWDVNPGNTLYEAYNTIINKSQEPPAESHDMGLEEERKILYDANGKPTPEKKAYDKYLELLDEIMREYEDHVSTWSSLQTEEEKSVWEEKLNIIHLKKERIKIDHILLGYKNEVNKAMAKINKSDAYDIFLSNLNAARNVLENAKKTGILSMASYLDINFVPYDFMSGNNGWVRLSLDKNELEELFKKTGAGTMGLVSLSGDYDEENIRSIELEYSVVGMQRHWFSVAPIVSEFFRWSGEKPIADGETLSGGFILPAYPKKLLLIRNLKLNLEPRVKEAEVSDINQIIRFGPIIMKNQLFTNAANNNKFIKPIRNKEVLGSVNVRTYQSKAEVTKPAAVPPIQPVASSVMSATLRQPVTVKRAFFSPALFQPVKVIAPVAKLTRVFIRLTDALSASPVYKSEISIVGTNNSLFKEIESDQEGKAETYVPVGQYALTIRKDGYTVFKCNLTVNNSNTLTLEYKLNPESVTYDTYYLIGMICEKLPKIAGGERG